jgi:pyridoxal phosphate enzyme (YggS family)
MHPDSPESRLRTVRLRIAEACRRAGRTAESVRLIAVGKTWPAGALRELAAAGQRAFGENHVQEALAKRAELADLALEWHLIGPLQSNKCRPAARHFDWLQSLDRPKLVPLLARERDPATPLQVLLQVKIDDEASKSGANPAAVPGLAEAVAGAPGLALRGLMTIPAPGPIDQRRRAFASLREQFERLRRDHPGMDTLSMGMSEDLEAAIAEGATMVRVGTALFGPRA